MRCLLTSVHPLAEYWKRGYEEVVSPNIFNLELWNISGYVHLLHSLDSGYKRRACRHALHYKENMFVFDVEGAEWGMKPMNCPAHCLIFGHRLRSYRELPIRMADFGGG
jgi:threonyl-tRNA synthetase